jgi:mRNA interferase MazF
MASFPKQSSVYWFDPEPAKGSEIHKIRPCIVVSPDDMNENLNTVLVIPLTSTIKAWPFRIRISILGRESSAACDQLRAYIGNLSKVESEKLYNLLQTIFSE